MQPLEMEPACRRGQAQPAVLSWKDPGLAGIRRRRRSPCWKAVQGSSWLRLNIWGGVPAGYSPLCLHLKEPS